MPEEKSKEEEKTAAGKPKAVANHHPCLRFQMESIEGKDPRTTTTQSSTGPVIPN